MAEKDTKPKTTAKPAQKAAKPVASGKTATPKQTAKPATTAKPAATAKQTAKPATTTKPATAAKQTAKPATTAKPAAAKQTEKPATTAKPAAATKQTEKPAATAKPAASEKKATSGEREKTQVAAITPVDKREKTQKPKKQKSSQSGENYSLVEAVKTHKVTAIIMASVAFLLVIAIVIGIVLGAKSCKKPIGFDGTAPTILPGNKVGDDNPTTAKLNAARPVIAPSETIEGEKFEYEYKANSAVGFSAQYKGNTERKRSNAYKADGTTERLNEGETFNNTAYPKYGYSLKEVLGADKTQARQNLIEESDYFCAQGTSNNSGNGNNGDASFTWMDADGYLYSGSTEEPVHAINADGTERKLYKHEVAEAMYYGGYKNLPDISDDEPGIVKEVTIRPRGYGSYSVTGVYAPAGEIVKIKISEEDMNATGGLTIHIGQALYNGQSNNIWAAKGQMQRFPNILNTMNVNKQTATLEDGYYTAYVGSFIGGPLYIRNTKATFTAEISGGVAYSHFILGYTTPEEFEKNNRSTVPYFDLEVWNYGVLHSGSKLYSAKFSYDDLYKAAVLWEKVASVTTTGSRQGIVFLYDPFVAAGAAVAFPGRSSVNCPADWMNGSLNYNGIVSSGAWGNFHEYHHNFQGYGVGAGGEVTNNGMTLVSYALFTKISSKRGISSYGGQGLGGWNNYTSATWALNDILKIRNGESPSNGNKGLALYATLLHNFGANNYIKAKVKGGGQSYQAYANAWEAVTHNNMSYYFNDVLKGGITSTAPSEYPMFVPVSSVYQTGRSYMYDGEKKYFRTMQPYVIPYGKEFNIDLSNYNAPNGQYQSGSVVIPDNFIYRIKSITQPENGTIEIVDNYNFKYKPNGNKLSGQIIATLEIKDKDERFKVDDVDLVLEFEQSHETNKMTLERTTYTYTAETMYTDAVTAYESGFKNHSSVVEKADHSNPTQNCNTDIWFYPDTEQMRKDHPNSPENHFVHPNTIEVLEGKLYFEEKGQYRIFLRGRTNCAVYYSLDGGKTYKLGAQVKNGSGSGFSKQEGTYFDLDLEANSWVYVKEVLIVQDKPVISYIGLGYGKWVEPMFTTVEKYYDKDNNEVASPEDPNYHHTTTHYLKADGSEATEEEVNNAKPTPPTGVSYINAYRSDYEFPDNTGFESDYFYTREYSYNYIGEEKFITASQSIVESQYQPWDNSPTHSINNLVDGNSETFIHSNKNPISKDNPFRVTVKLSETVTASRLIFHGSAKSSNYATYMPKDLKIWVSGNGTEWTQVSDKTNAPYSNLKQTVDFDGGFHTFSYYKIEVTSTHARNNLGYICLSRIELSSLLVLSGGEQFTPDNDAFTYGGNWQTKNTQSTFGHVYVGAANATMSFKFNGKRLVLLSSEAFGKNFEITIDGKKAESLQLKPVTGGYGASFISELLEDKEHTVVIKCKGEANLDSVVVYK